jgi:hypothetical protein
VLDLSEARPANPHDGSAVLSGRFAARNGTLGDDPKPVVATTGMTVAAQLLASWFAPVEHADEDP